MIGVEGSWPALVTPYRDDGSTNLEEFRRHIDFHVEYGSDGLLVLGSTSESTLLTKDEKQSLVTAAVDQVNDRIPVMCGISASTTGETIENAHFMKDSGVQYGVLVQPSYIKPSQEAIYSYYKEVADTVDLPLVIYNNPSRTGGNIEPET